MPKHKDLFELFKPTTEDWKKIYSVYWGYDKKVNKEIYESTNLVEMEFTPLRQTIILFLAVINNEL